MENFIKNFANQFDDTEFEEFTSNTKFRDLEEWSSLVALAILNMIAKKYDVVLNHEEMRTTNTIQELMVLVISKK